MDDDDRSDVERRMKFLWEAGMFVGGKNSVMGSLYIDDVKELAGKLQLGLSSKMQSQVCMYCSGVMGESMNGVQKKVVKWNQVSKRVRRGLGKGRKNTLKNVLVVTCNVCGKKNYFPGAQRQYVDKVRKIVGGNTSRTLERESEVEKVIDKRRIDKGGRKDKDGKGKTKKTASLESRKKKRKNLKKLLMEKEKERMRKGSKKGGIETETKTTKLSDFLASL